MFPSFIGDIYFVLEYVAVMPAVVNTKCNTLNLVYNNFFLFFLNLITLSFFNPPECRVLAGSLEYLILLVIVLIAYY